MWNKPTEKQLAALPKVGQWDRLETPTKDQLVSMHFFLGGNDVLSRYLKENQKPKTL
jgi:hypothetical protein